MTQRKRSIVGLLWTILLFGGGIALLHHGVYGWTIFLLCPAALGIIASWVLRPETASKAFSLGALAVLVGSLLLMVFAVEGVVCVIMALPITASLGAFGSWLVFRAGSPPDPRSITMLLLLPPVALVWDVKAPPPVFEVKTSVVIQAEPEKVWNHVVAFSEIPEPQEWFFRTGLAYPKRAYFEGSGKDAIRYCEFSTGSFVEPIEIWEEPRLLRFSVTESPAPMREWSPYGDLDAKHLHGYMVSKRGQFRLTPLAGEGTLLEGTTWYQHGLWPAEYWRWWSDAIIHRIHLRVLHHIRQLSEQETT